MDSNKSDIDSTRKLIEFYENIEKLCCSEEISAKELSHIIYESVKTLSKKNGVKSDHRLKFFHDFSNYEGEFNDKQVKRLFYETFRKAHLSLLQSINNAQPITENFSERNQDASDFLPTAADFRDNSNDSDKDSDVESLSLQSTDNQSTSENLSEKNCIVSDEDSEFLHDADEPVHDFNNNGDATGSNTIGNIVDTDTRVSTDKTDTIEEITNEKESTQKKLSIVELEKELISRTPFVVINDLVYHYDENAHYYKLVDQDDVIGLYRYYIDPALNDAPNLRCFNDLYRCIKTDPSLKRTIDFEQETYCPLQDGIYFFHNGQICREDHSPKHITFTCLKASRIPPKKTQEERRATCPSFIKFIEDTSGNDEDVRDRILMALGYLLVDTKRGKFFFLAGFKPNTGKSLLFNFIQRLYPQDSVSNLPVGDLGGRFESEALLHSRINISLDLPQEPLSASAVAKLKQITGGDTVEVQRKGKTSKKLDHPVKLVFASNSRLRLKKYDKAFWNRLIYLPFENTVTNEDPELSEKFWNERDGIVSLLLLYAKKLEDLDYKFPEILEDSTKFPISKNPVDFVQNFIDDCCETGNSDFYCLISKLKHVYKQYCFMNCFPTCSRTEFNDYLESIGIYQLRLHYPTPMDETQRLFHGIKLKATIYNLMDEV